MKTKRNGAQSTMELVGGLIVLVPIILLIVDLSAIVMAAFKNDSICREACRAAAGGDPKDAQRIAQSEINKYNQGAGGFSTYTLSAPPSVTVENPDAEHGLVSGNVTVRTKAQVHAPFIVGFISPNISLQSEQSFPYTYTKP